MITLYAFANIFEGGVGETKDMRAQWALEETGLPYRVHELSHQAGDLDSDAYTRLNPFRQVPVIDDDGFVISESGAIVLYLAEKAGKLIPKDVQGRTRVMQWCFAATSTVGAILQCVDVADIFDGGKKAPQLHVEVRNLAGRFLGGVERRLQDREWLACAEFTVADITMANVLRSIRKTDLMDPFPKLKSYYERCHARPAWERTLELSAKRLSVTVESIR